MFCKAAYEYHIRENKPVNQILSGFGTGTTGLKSKKDNIGLSDYLPSKFPNKLAQG